MGLNAVVNWAHRTQESGGDVQAAHELFWWIYDAARRLWLTAGHDLERRKQTLVPLCFAFMPELFGSSLPDALRRAVPPIANEPWMVCSAGWFLWANGIEPERLVSLLRDAGADLRGSLRDAFQWAKLTESEEQRRTLRENPEFPANLEELARALNLKLDEPEAIEPPPATERTRRRDELSSRIPWGAALLRRLDEEGLSLQQIIPHDANTWLVQATVPPALRDRFGLSPEIRILVLHGQVRGRDLRMAMQEPAGAASVDPDLIVIASDQPELARRLPRLAGPWGQRIPWPPIDGQFAPLADTLREHLPAFDLFEYRDPVQGSALVGREAQVDDISARLLRGEAVGVVGLRKVGKSSLLRAVAEILDPIGARLGMFESLTVPLPEAEPEALVISIDVQGVAGRELAVLLERLGERLEERLALAGIKHAPPTNPKEIFLDAKETPDADPMEKLRGLLRMALSRTTLPICFILDEYDLLFEGYSGEAGIPGVERLLGMLRSEAQATGRVGLALVGRDPVFLDRPLLGGFTNPLAGWAKPVFLGPLTRDGADELLLRLGKRVGLDVGAATRETAWQWTGGHPLLLRQYGAALYELAQAPPSRPRPVPTDPIHEDAVELFLKRDAVHTICSEVRALLDARFPEALSLLEALADAPPEQARAIMERHGGPSARGVTVLSRFGLMMGKAEQPSLPRVYRAEFSVLWPRIRRSVARGA